MIHWLQAAHDGSLHQRLHREGMPPAQESFLSPLERSIAVKATQVLQDATALLSDDVLPFGWEVAYTATGEKYYLE
jgi:hypothetical protein